MAETSSIAPSASAGIPALARALKDPDANLRRSAAAALGLWSFQQLKIEAYPDISDTQVVVVTLYPGRAAEEVEQQVTVPIEPGETHDSLSAKVHAAEHSLLPSVIARLSATGAG